MIEKWSACQPAKDGYVLYRVFMMNAQLFMNIFFPHNLVLELVCCCLCMSI